LFPNSLRSALEVYLAGVPRRAGRRGHRRAWLLNQFLDEKKREDLSPRHQVFDYLQMAAAIGADVSTPMEPLANPARVSARRIGICPGAEYGPAKRWLPERFAEVAQRVSAQRDCEWMLLGVKKDREIGAHIAAVLDGRCVDLIGKTTLGELIERLRECRLLLTNDTGTMHLAAHLGVPTVAIFGSTEPALTGPLGSNHRVIRHHVECSPCFLRECPIDVRCMKVVSVEEVTEAVLAALGSD
jgi:heptosyltransferase-2